MRGILCGVEMKKKTRKMTVLKNNGVTKFKPHPIERRTQPRFKYYILATSKDKINPKSGLLVDDGNVITDNINDATPFNTFEEIDAMKKSMSKLYPNYFWTHITRSVV